MVIETAVNGGGDVIATFNIDNMRAGAAGFGIAAERPAAVLRRFEQDLFPLPPNQELKVIATAQAAGRPQTAAASGGRSAGC